MINEFECPVCNKKIVMNGECVECEGCGTFIQTSLRVCPMCGQYEMVEICYDHEDEVVAETYCKFCTQWFTII